MPSLADPWKWKTWSENRGSGRPRGVLSEPCFFHPRVLLRHSQEQVQGLRPGSHARPRPLKHGPRELQLEA